MLQTPEQRARQGIEDQLQAARWIIQDPSRINLAAGRGIAVREFPLQRGHGTADYRLCGDRKALGTIEAKPDPWTKTLWIYDLRTNKNFALKTHPLKREDLDDFVRCYHPENRHERVPTWSEDTPQGRWRASGYEEIAQREKASLDIFWLRDESLEVSANLPDPDMIAAEIAEDLQAALDQFAQTAEDLSAERTGGPHVTKSVSLARVS